MWGLEFEPQYHQTSKKQPFVLGQVVDYLPIKQTLCPGFNPQYLKKKKAVTKTLIAYKSSMILSKSLILKASQFNEYNSKVFADVGKNLVTESNAYTQKKNKLM